MKLSRTELLSLALGLVGLPGLVILIGALMEVFNA